MSATMSEPMAEAEDRYERERARHDRLREAQYDAMEAVLRRMKAMADSEYLTPDDGPILTGLAACVQAFMPRDDDRRRR